MDSLAVTLTEGIAFLTLDVPGDAVNKITREVREELGHRLDDLARQEAVRAVVLRSAKADAFIAGADMHELLALRSREEAERLVRAGQRLIERLARLGKPVVAAVHGACLGGGMEAILACSYRVASDDPTTRFGFPEVQLGVVPAAGGCQRLPRLIGVRPALDMIVAGRQLSARRALRVGLVEEAVHPAVLDQVALEAARRLADGWRPPRGRFRRVRSSLDQSAMKRRMTLAAVRKQAHKETGGHYPAPLKALDAVEHGLRHGIDAGQDMEAAHFSELVVGEVARNLMRLFFATTALKKDHGVEGDVPGPRSVNRVAVVGAGFMGGNVAGVAVHRAEVDVRLRDTDLRAVGRGIETARGVLRAQLREGNITGYEHRRLERLVSGGTNWDGFARADLVLEAVYEDVELKREVMRDIERRVPADCVIASNTSTIPIGRLALALARPERLVGMHFFSPVETSPLVEVVVTEATDAWVVVTAVAFGRRLGKTVIVARDHPGFWVNRMLVPYLSEAVRLVEEGVSVEQIDAAMTEYGFPVGPIALLDDLGWDVAAKASAVLSEAFGDRMPPVAGVGRMTEEERLGRKVGRGFYRYEQGRRRGVDQSAYEIVRAVPDSLIPRDDIAPRMISVLLNEAARAVDEGVVRQPRDGDVGAVFGFGFPAFRGGPLRCIDTLGADQVVRTLRSLAQRYGARFAPCAALARLAEAGERFHPRD